MGVGPVVGPAIGGACLAEQEDSMRVAHGGEGDRAANRERDESEVLDARAAPQTRRAGWVRGSIRGDVEAMTWTAHHPPSIAGIGPSHVHEPAT